MPGSIILNWDKVVKSGRDVSWFFNKGVRGKFDCGAYLFYPVFVREYHRPSDEDKNRYYKNDGFWALWRDSYSECYAFSPDAYCYDTYCSYSSGRWKKSREYCMDLDDRYLECRYAVPVSDEQIPCSALDHIPEWTPVFFRYGDGDIDECGWGLVRFGKLFDGKDFHTIFNLDGYKFYYGPNEDIWESSDDEDDNLDEPDVEIDADCGVGRYLISWDI